MEGTDLFHVRQMREIGAACNPKLPQEELAVRILVGAGVRRAELCGLAVQGPDGLAVMDRLSERAGFRVHAHGFRHTFATVATKLGWNFERLRAAMGHEDYMTLQRYVRLAVERDLGRLNDWTEFIAEPPHVGAMGGLRWQ